MSFFVVRIPEPDDVDGTGIQDGLMPKFRRARHERRLPFRRRVPREIDRGTAVMQAKKRRQAQIRGPADAGDLEFRARPVDCPDRGKQIVPDQGGWRTVIGSVGGTEVRCKNQRAKEKCHGRGIVRRRLQAQAQWQAKLDAIAGFPAPSNREVPASSVAACMSLPYTRRDGSSHQAGTRSAIANCCGLPIASMFSVISSP